VLRETRKSIIVNVNTRKMTTSLETQKITKITLIEDINKSVLFLFGRTIDVQEFDTLYDFSEFELELTLKELQSYIDFKTSIG
jgi:hypothetical protein